MPQQQLQRQREWIERYGKRESVQNWIRDNPPPKQFQGSGEEWAYLEMPIFVLGGR